MRITITGAAGNLGEYVIKQLETDHELLLFDLKPRGDAPRFQNHEYLQGDLLNYEDCQKAVEGADAIVHLAAIRVATDIPGMLEKIEQLTARMGNDPSKHMVFDRTRMGLVLPRPLVFDDGFRINVVGTWYLLTAMVEAGVDTIVAATSNAVFGWDWLGSHPEAVKYLPLDERHPIYPGGYSYDLSKALDEEILAGFTRRCGIKTYAFRLGRLRRPDNLKELAEDMAPATGWLVNFFNYLDVRDAARAFRQCLEAAGEIESPHEAFCLTAADTVAQEDSKVLVEKFQPGFADKAAKLVGRQSMISCDKAKAYFGYEAQHSWRDYLS